MQPMKQIDKDIKNKLEGMELAPAPEVWQRIAAAQAAVKRQRRLWIIGLSSLILLLGVATVLWYQSDHGQSVSQQIGASDALADQVSNPSSDIDGSVTTSKTDAQMALATESNETQTEDATSFSPAESIGSLEDQKTAASKSQEIDRSTRVSVAQDQISTTESRNFTTDRFISNQAGEEQSSIRNQEDQSLPATSQPDNVSEARSATPVEEVDRTKFRLDDMTTESRVDIVELAEETNAVTDDIDYAILMPRVDAYPSALIASPLQYQMSGYVSDEARLEATLQNMSCEMGLFASCYKFEPPSSRFYVDMYYSTNHAWSNISSDNTDLAEHVSDRSASERMRSSYGFGMRFSSHVMNSVMLRTGLAYTRVNEDFLHVEEQVVDRILNRIEIDTVIDPGSMDTLITMDSIYTDVVETTRYDAENHYEFLDIPLEIGYSWSKRRWTMTAYGGVILNVAFDRQGTILNPDGEPIRFNNGDIDNQVIFRTKVGLSLTGSVQAAYALTPSIDVFAEPHMRYVLAPINLDVQPVDKKLRLAGLQTGIRFKL